MQGSFTGAIWASVHVCIAWRVAELGMAAMSQWQRITISYGMDQS